jgi:hypothetical protein
MCPDQEDYKIFHTIGNLLLWVVFLLFPYCFSSILNFKMNTRGKVQLISGLILDYFKENKVPLWKEVQSDFINFDIVKLT